jgi:Adenosine deaminase
MKQIILSLVGLLVALGVPLAQAATSDAETLETETTGSGRYELRAEYDESLLPLLADGKQQIEMRIQVVDTEAQVIKRLKFLLQSDDPALSGTITSETLRNEYLVTYTTPDLRQKDIEETSERLIITYTDDADRQRYKEIAIPLRNANTISISKPGFIGEQLALDMTGPFAYVDVQARVSGGETIPVRAARLEGTLLPEMMATDAKGQHRLKIHRPRR